MIHTAANDNEPTQAWIELVEDVKLFDKLVSNFPELCWRIKSAGGGNRERSVVNFIWFMRFEISFRENEVRLRREQIKIA